MVRGVVIPPSALKGTTTCMQGIVQFSAGKFDQRAFTDKLPSSCPEFTVEVGTELLRFHSVF